MNDWVMQPMQMIVPEIDWDRHVFRSCLDFAPVVIEPRSLIMAPTIEEILHDIHELILSIEADAVQREWERLTRDVGGEA